MSRLICIVLSVWLYLSANALTPSAVSSAINVPQNENKIEESKPEPIVLFDLYYESMKFNKIKYHSSYGFTVTGLSWPISSNWLTGFTVGMAGNWGMYKDAGTITFKAGPCIGTNINKNLIFTIPLNLVAYFGSHYDPQKDKMVDDFDMGMSITPTIYATEGRLGIFAGPMLTVPFTNNLKTSIGFHLGVSVKF